MSDPFTDAEWWSAEDVERAAKAIVDGSHDSARVEGAYRVEGYSDEFARAVLATVSLDRMQEILTEAGRLTDEADERETHFTTEGYHTASVCEGYPECPQRPE